MKVTRRSVLVGGGIGVGLIVGYALWPRRLNSPLPVADGEQAFGAYVKIGRDGRVTVAVPQVETGQGIWTALPQVVADELGAAWETVGVEPAPIAAGYDNPLIGDGKLRITAGSTSVRAFETPMRKAAATAREMLIAEAADRWNVDETECSASGGFVRAGSRSASFGELAEAAAARRPLRSGSLRTDAGSRLIGQPLQRLDSIAKSKGGFRFAGDVRLPGMLYAALRAAPPGGRLEHFDRAVLNGRPGVRHVSATDAWIAIVADSWWQAERALHAAAPRFSAPASEPFVRPLFERALDGGDASNRFERGDYDAVTRDARALAATYYVAPSQHLGLEPLTATARVTPDGAEVWAGTQSPGLDEATLYPLGVGEPAGRAVEPDAVPIAIALARATGRPVQAAFSAEASQNHDRPAPGLLARMTALPGSGGITAAWQMRVATANGLGAALSRLRGRRPAGSLDDIALDGAVPPYGIPNLRVQAIAADLPIRAGYMRGSPQRELTFCTESFVDELARAAGLEPLAFRMAMLGNNGRLARCFQGAARRAGWDGGAPGSTMGIAGCSAFGSHIALVASAHVGDGQRIKVDRLVAAVDCGRVVNTSLAAQQIEAGMIWALAQATISAAEWVAGMPRARPFGALALPGIGDTPEIVIDFISSDSDPGGLSGLGASVVGPAIANALFAATGRRLRNLPFDLADAA